MWEGLDSFFYCVSCYTDRGGFAKSNGITLCENNLLEYERVYSVYKDLPIPVPVAISKRISENCGYDVQKNGHPPRAILRDYFMLGFYNHFSDDMWLKNEELKRSSAEKIKLEDILDYDKLSHRLHEIFGIRLDFGQTYAKFFSLNLPLAQLVKVKTIIDAIEKNEQIDIAGLNVISEAYLSFCLEKKFFDVPIRAGDIFFKTTKELSDYITYYPKYLRQPNKLFSKNFKIYKRS